jgi:hypothetical protein
MAQASLNRETDSVTSSVKEEFEFDTMNGGKEEVNFIAAGTMFH